MEVDVDALIHAYDARKAHEYYIRTRQLKGRRAGSAASPVTKAEFKKAASGNEGKYDRFRPVNQRYSTHQKEARKEAEARLEHLLDRLGHLRKLLEQEVEAAKKRNERNTNTSNSPSSSSKSSKSGGGSSSSSHDDPVSPADKQKAEKDRSPLTAKQKRENAKRARENYEKKKKAPEHPQQNVQQDIEEVQAKIREIRARLQDAIAEGRKKASDKPKSKTASKGR